MIDLSPWHYFSLNELRCKCGSCGSTGLEMDDQFMQKLILLRNKIGVIKLTSAYRCPTHNLALSYTGENGPHTTGKAVDIITSGENAILLLKEAIDLGFCGFGIKQKSMNRFIHLDTCGNEDNIPRPAIWSY